MARRYRNRRIGEFLKELRLTEGRGTGVPSIFKAMRDNGSPRPRFETDAERTFFTTILPIHPLALPGRGQEDLLGADLEDVPEILYTVPRRWVVLRATVTPQSRSNLQAQLGLSDANNFRRVYLYPLIEAGLVAPTIPGSLHAPNQRYQATDLGRALLKERRLNPPSPGKQPSE